jgi:nucleotide-binding universal stress UspA family protein
MDDRPGHDGESRRVVAGFDARWQHRSFLVRAAREAERRKLPLTVVTVLRRQGDLDRGPRGVQADDPRAAASARRHLNDALEFLRLAHPLLQISGLCLSEDEIQQNRPYPFSCADLLMIGARGRFQQTALYMESVSRVLLKAAQCPVLIVPETQGGQDSHPSQWRPSQQFVLAGISAHPADTGVARAAFEEAVRRGCHLHLLHACPPGPEVSRAGRMGAAWDVIRRVTAAAEIPATRLSVTLTLDPAAAALSSHSASAAVLVIGGRPGALSGLVRDSVSRDVLQHAACPVLAIPRDIPFFQESRNTA